MFSRSIKFSQTCWMCLVSDCIKKVTANKFYCTYPGKIQYREINKGQAAMFKKLLGLSQSEAHLLLKKSKALRQVDFDHIQQTVKMLERFGVNKENYSLHPTVLAVRPHSVEQHAMLLQEGGITVSAYTLLNFVSMSKRRISLLKAHGLLPQSYDVTASLASHLEPEMPPLQSLSDSATFVEMHRAVLEHYMHWRLDMSPAEVERALALYPRFKHKSFRLMRQMLDLLENNIGFSRDKIRRHLYLTYINPAKTLETIRRAPYMAGLEIRQLFQLCPKIVSVCTDTLIKTAEHLKNCGVPDAEVARCPYVLTLSSDTVIKRIKSLQSHPDLHALANHRRALRLVHYQRKVWHRVEVLEEMGVRSTSLHMLSSTDAAFARYTREGLDRLRGNDLINFLGSELQCDTSVLRTEFIKHPFWRHVALSDVVETLRFLSEKGYTKSEIISSIHIVLYPQSKVKQELDTLLSRPEVKKNIQRKIRLALCVYYMEKEHHFTGDGIWTVSHIPAQQSVLE